MQIKNRYTGAVIFEADCENMIDLLGEAMKAGADLRGANLSGANRLLTIIHGSKHTLIAHSDGMQVGCQIKPWEWWTSDNITELGKREDYSDNQIAEYKNYIDFVRGLYVKDLTGMNNK